MKSLNPVDMEFLHQKPSLKIKLGAQNTPNNQPTLFVTFYSALTLITLNYQQTIHST